MMKKGSLDSGSSRDCLKAEVTMTNLKFIMLLALITCTKTTQPEEDQESAPVKVIHATLVQALQYPDLLEAMHYQLDPGFMKSDQQLFIGEVVFGNFLFRILGTYDQWRAFICCKWELLAGWGGVVMSHN
jgi:hypothetical protein